MKGKYKVPTLVSGVGSIATIVAAVMGEAGNRLGRETLSTVDWLVSTENLGTLMSNSLTAGSLVLAVWGVVVSREEEIFRRMSTVTEGIRQSVRFRIDELLLASYLWYISFASFLLGYLWANGLDKVVDVETGSGNMFNESGFFSIGAVGDEVATPMIFFTGISFLVAATWATMRAIHALIPNLATRANTNSGSEQAAKSES